MIKRFFKIILIASAIILFLDTMQNTLSVNSAVREASVTKVINGNTLKVWLDKEGYEETIQLIGVKPKEGAKEYIESLLNENGNIVYLQSDKNDIENGSHVLRYVWLDKPKKLNAITITTYQMLNARMIEYGYATPKKEKHNTKYQDDFEQIYRTAN